MIAHENAHVPLGIDTRLRESTSIDFDDVDLEDLKGLKHVYVTVRLIPRRMELSVLPTNISVERAVRVLTEISDTLVYKGPEIMTIPDTGTDQCTVQVFCYPDRQYVHIRSENLCYEGTIQLLNMAVAEINRKLGERNGS